MSTGRGVTVVYWREQDPSSAVDSCVHQLCDLDPAGLRSESLFSPGGRGAGTQMRTAACEVVKERGWWCPAHTCAEMFLLLPLQPEPVRGKEAGANQYLPPWFFSSLQGSHTHTHALGRNNAVSSQSSIPPSLNV